MTHGYILTFNGQRYSDKSDEWSMDDAKSAALSKIESLFSSLKTQFESKHPFGLQTQEDRNEWNSIREKYNTAKNSIDVYKTGGLVDYTGPAWVDGTKQRPEAFLSAVDTQNIRDLLDAFNYIKTPRMSYYDTMKLGNTTNSIGTVSVTINGAQFEDDADYEAIAQRVGEEFARELQKQGFNTSNYAF